MNGKQTGYGKIIALVVALVVLVAAVLSIGNFFENLDAGQVMVVQSPIKGTLTWYTSQGVKWQGFGKVTKYDRRIQYWFTAQVDQGGKQDQSIKVRFNDGGHAQISGSLSWEMPLDEDHLTRLHRKYGSQQAIEQQLVRPVVEKSVYMTGPLMSSKESYAERRNDLLALIEDQMQFGVYQTETREVKATDPMTNQPKTVNVVTVKLDAEKKPLRSDVSPLTDFGIKTYNLSINEVKYDGTVEQQIQEQQKATMQVQLAVAQAKEAEQKAITVAKQGEATAAQAKWEQESIKAKAVVTAEQEKQVAVIAAQKLVEVAEQKKLEAVVAAKQKVEVAEQAKLEAEQNKLAAEQTKQEQTLLGEGEAARKRLVMEADGALQQKLDAYVRVNQVYADAIKGYSGNWVPSIVMGGGGSTTQSTIAGSGADQLIQLLMAKSARDLSLDLSVTGSTTSHTSAPSVNANPAVTAPVNTN